MRIQRKSDDAIAAQLGEALRERRLRQNITQDQLAAQVGVSTPTLQKMEKGRGTLQLLIAVLRELGALDLLSSLVELPRISPIAAAQTGKTGRVRALGVTRNSQGRIRTYTTSPEPHHPQGGHDAQPDKVKPLLIPRKH
ncbi:XRE family transcriptional regulator [Pseudomonas reidholzensis]|uniref:XRE family transcriptional regulator n=1 Tax=Pseudomonas reidholzensis TaxID=1785162 RepID=A0A383RQY6_9PSED|nr:helix-turn-helix transcriptional regulator [Pseudomonas reidholzensis]SYX89462.1 XRE family transcriptional regulator [Pseudomonas reidholzensis]